MKFQKIKKPVTKKIWGLLSYLPYFLRKRILRSQFGISYDIPSDYVFKQAETEDEIEQALRLVYDSYTKLGYINKKIEQLHFNTFLCLPTTTILILKHRDEVIGTMSIVPDSPFGLPCEATWDIKAIKASKKRVAEVSSLTIKNTHKNSRGHLLLTFCKLMYEYNLKTLNLDAVFMAATLEVEPFYTDLLLFKRAVPVTGQEHKSVNGNKSTCCVLDFNEAKAEFIREYGSKEKEKNLFYFFTSFKSPNIQLPSDRISLNGLLLNKNRAMTNILKKFPTLTEIFSNEDRQKISNLDPTKNIHHAIGIKDSHASRHNPRVAIKSIDVHIYHGTSDKVSSSALMDISARGFGVKLVNPDNAMSFMDKCILLLKADGEHYSVHAQVRWSKDSLVGFEVMELSRFDWQKFANKVFGEINLPIDQEINVPMRKIS